MGHGPYVFIDPDEQSIDLMEVDSLDVDSLCDLLRCDATDAIKLPFLLMAYIDGEGAWQGRQTEWELNDESFWGPMLVFKGMDDVGYPAPCEEEDLDKLEPLIHFWDT
ncbi:MAG: hypothetical protein HQM13_15020 [SAR324 cluster bacterium]|nr:hypothetical protein [SAR324 cluster bacterium]